MATDQVFNYDGYGVLLGYTGTPQTNLLYSGEYFDTDLQQYNLRARYYDPLNGRFNQLAPYAGNNQDPQSLHKYLYCHANPVNGIDPSGKYSVGAIALSIVTVLLIIALIYDAFRDKNKPPAGATLQTIYGLQMYTKNEVGYLADDLVNKVCKKAYDKHLKGVSRWLAYSDWDQFKEKMKYLDTVFFDIGKDATYRYWKFSYEEKQYTASEVNYLGVGLGFKHFHISLFSHMFVDLWNLLGDRDQGPDMGGYGHLGTSGEHYWTTRGMAEYSKINN